MKGVEVAWPRLSIGEFTRNHQRVFAAAEDRLADTAGIIRACVELIRGDLGIFVLRRHHRALVVVQRVIQVDGRAKPIAERLDREHLALGGDETVPVAVVRFLDLPGNFTGNGEDSEPFPWCRDRPFQEQQGPRREPTSHCWTCRSRSSG